MLVLAEREALDRLQRVDLHDGDLDLCAFLVGDRHVLTIRREPGGLDERMLEVLADRYAVLRCGGDRKRGGQRDGDKQSIHR